MLSVSTLHVRERKKKEKYKKKGKKEREGKKNRYPNNTV